MSTEEQIDSSILNLLLVEDVPAEARLMRETLADLSHTEVRVHWEARLSSALARLEAGGVDLVILDLGLPDSVGLDTFHKLQTHTSSVPVIVVTGTGDHSVGIMAVQSGAQDYIPKDQIDANLLGRSVRYSIERKRLEEELRQSQKLEVVGRLAGGVAHEFNNLLTGILGNARLSSLALKQDHPAFQPIQEIENAAHQASQITRQLLAVSRQGMVKLETVDLIQVIEDIGDRIRRIIGRDIDLVTVFSEGPAWVEIDNPHMEQILLDLAMNSREAITSGGEFKIEVKLSQPDSPTPGLPVDLADSPYVILTVSDDGAGMTAEVMSHVFEPFFTTKEVGKGPGLGLSTCFGLVKQFGGHMQVRSQQFHGTTFDIFLPQTQAPPQQNEGQATSETATVPQTGATLLLAEDEALLLLLFSEVLTQQGYTVIKATDGEQALSLSKEHPADSIQLLITDVVMPRMRGPELVPRIREFHPKLKVLYTSGYTGETASDLAPEGTAVEFMRKPFTVDDLVERIQAILGS